MVTIIKLFFILWMTGAKMETKLLLIGDSGAGKSSLLLAFAESRFLSPDEATATVGVDFRSFHKDYKGERRKVCVWDTAGQERFRTMTESFYRNASVVFLVFDVSNRETYDNLESWCKEIEKKCINITGCLVANKIDIPEVRL